MNRMNPLRLFMVLILKYLIHQTRLTIRVSIYNHILIMVSQGWRWVYTTATSATRRVVTYHHMITENSSALSLMTEGTTSTLKYTIACQNILKIGGGDAVESTFKILKPSTYRYGCDTFI